MIKWMPLKKNIPMLILNIIQKIKSIIFLYLHERDS